MIIKATGASGFQTQLVPWKNEERREEAERGSVSKETGGRLSAPWGLLCLGAFRVSHPDMDEVNFAETVTFEPITAYTCFQGPSGHVMMSLFQSEVGSPELLQRTLPSTAWTPKGRQCLTVSAPRQLSRSERFPLLSTVEIHCVFLRVIKNCLEAYPGPAILLTVVSDMKFCRFRP